MDVTLQSLIAIFAGADVWRLAHRRNLLSKHEIHIHLDITFVNSRRYADLAENLAKLADEGDAFVGHIDSGLDDRISVRILRPDMGKATGEDVVYVEPKKMAPVAAPAQAIAGIDPTEMLDYLKRKTVDYQKLVDKFGKATVDTVVGDYFVPRLRDRSATAAQALVLASLIGYRSDIDQAFEDMAKLVCNVLTGNLPEPAKLEEKEKDRFSQGCVHQFVNILSGDRGVLTPSIWKAIDRLASSGGVETSLARLAAFQARRCPFSCSDGQASQRRIEARRIRLSISFRDREAGRAAVDTLSDVSRVSRHDDREKNIQPSHDRIPYGRHRRETVGRGISKDSDRISGGDGSRRRHAVRM